MRRTLASLAALGLIGSLTVSEIHAQRVRGVIRTRVGRATAAGRITPPNNPAITPRRTAPPALPGPRLQPPITSTLPSRFNPPKRPNPFNSPIKPPTKPNWTNDLRNHLGVPTPAVTVQQRAFQWVDPQYRPFSPAWYAAHPNAWKITHPHADAAAVVSAVALAQWLALPYAATTSNTATSSAIEPATATETDPPPTPDELAWFGADELTDDSQWMDIGVFALKPVGQAEATRMICLYVTREGVLRGSHYDLISEEAQHIRGAVNKGNLQAAWTIGEKGTVVFQTPLDELTEPQGTVSVHFPNGQIGTWQTVRAAQ